MTGFTAERQLVARLPSWRLGSISNFSGLWAECVRTIRTLCCHDADTDSRVNGTACRELGICSILTSPIRCGGTVVGVLKLSSTRAFAFDEADAQMLAK